MNDVPSFREDHISQIPALQLLQHLGYSYLTPQEALELRGGRLSNVLLEGVLTDYLRRANAISYRGRSYPFSEGNILSAVQAVKDVPFDGLVRTNQKIYELLTLPKSLPQSIDGDVRSFDLRYIDFDVTANNLYHVTDEFAVERAGSHDVRRPDIVLFVNGIPLAVIECKRPDLKDPVGQAVSQQLRNQHEDEIPSLFVYSQLLLAVAKNEARYGTAGTPARFWTVWKEEGLEDELRALVNRPLPEDAKARLFGDGYRYGRAFFDALEAGGREVTEQDRALYALCRPERLLELMFGFTLFDAGQKKVARYQQYFTVRSILERVRRRDEAGARLGGVVWHTQGSGKSLTMVMIAQAIALEPGIDDFKIILVTDRVDLDDQIYRTFGHCGAEVVQAKTGRHLADLIQGHRARIITTVIDKFEAALARATVVNDSPNVFALVDEGHRGQYGHLHAQMRVALPRACFIAFTGTPVVKREKNTIQRFGGLIAPTYTISQAVADKAVVPLLYEGRHVDQMVYGEPMDREFSRVTENLSDAQAADLKRKFSTTDQLNQARQKVKEVAYDISRHYQDTFQGTGLKGQLVAPNKATALLYKEFLDELGEVSAEVLISGPDEREGYTDTEDANRDAVVRFWQKMMARFGSEKEYNRQLINAFTHGEEPEIIIVVDKLLTGFDAPRNTVLYLTRKLEGHALLQAIARVNRLCEGKDYGYIVDYRGVLHSLDEALGLYGEMAEFDEGDLLESVTDVGDVIATLPERHAAVWELFRGVRNTRDEEAYELALADEERRGRFYERLSSFARTLAIALSSAVFVRETPTHQVETYKRDLKFFMNLRTSVRRRYAEAVDFKEYEGRIQKLIDTHVGTGEVEQLTGLVDIFDREAFADEVARLDSPSAKADTIAHRTKKTITERMDEDPEFYRKFSDLLEDAIRAFRQERLSDVEYLDRVRELSESVRNRTGDEIPPALEHRDVAKAYYGVALRVLQGSAGEHERAVTLSTEAALRIEEIIDERRIVNWSTNADVQNRMRTEIEDSLFELKEREDLDLSFDDIDEIMERCLDIARVRRA